ncbi:hypothetical protein [Haloarchaeobius sp. DT45]|uniref:hypothetical protein n=1 Tax=Haloarchaeobius sp. DT45 TaxID=3446116 RepID=UPI003F6B17F6
MDDEKLVEAITEAVDDDEVRDAVAEAMADDEVRNALAEAVEEEAVKEASSRLMDARARDGAEVVEATATAAGTVAETHADAEEDDDDTDGDTGGEVAETGTVDTGRTTPRTSADDEEDEADDDSLETHELIQRLVDEWTPPDSTDHSYPMTLRSYLDAELNEDVESVWERHIVETRHGQDTCDVIVDGVIGIKFVHDFSKGDLMRLSRSLQAYATQHKHLIVYVHGSSALVNRWRILKRKYTAERIGVESFAFVIESRPGTDPNPRGDGKVSKGVAGFTALVTLVGIALVEVAAFVTFGTDVAAVLGFVMAVAWLAHQVYTAPARS